MANKADFIKRVQNHSGVTYEMVQTWNNLIAEYKYLHYGVADDSEIITDADIEAACMGDKFDAATFIGLMTGAEGLSAALDISGNLAAMCKVKT